MADERLPCSRSVWILLIRSVGVVRRLLAISFSARQNSSSRLILVLCPASTTECLATDDLMAPLRAGAFGFYDATLIEPVE